MGRHIKKRALVGGTPRADAVRTVHDRYWARELRSAVLCGVLLFGALVLLDWGLVRLTAVRAGWWAALAVLLLIILTPPRVSAADGGLDARGLVTHRRVRTDRLVTVRMSEGVSQRVILTDTSGGRLMLDPQVLIANPLLWHQLDQGVRRSVQQGTLRCGMPVLERLGRRIDGDACRGILRASGMD
ncbi:hypothetical protein OG828_05640 [Streptomyces sp. NBC_00457]|uniref:hypothetical protein n=1 Tax=unclassified Streptomyces TaxID=2593676 RepID=UPI002E2379B9|nr:MULTISPECIES: hypothetical protein [unclassified Streptomyces]